MKINIFGKERSHFIEKEEIARNVLA